MTEPTDIQTTPNGSVEPHEEDLLPVDVIVQRTQAVQEVMNAVMKEDQHYGVIPGTGDKPTLLKPGAEKISALFRLAPRYDIKRRRVEPTDDIPPGHIEYEVRCRLVHIPDDKVWGEGVGLCSTLEKKYRYRTAKLSCPDCGEEAVIKGKEEYGGGWLCWKKKGGCGAKWDDGAPEIEDQERGKVENPDIADTYNTVLKMAKKRAHVDATLTATAASDFFTQDVEDLPEFQKRTSTSQNAQEADWKEVDASQETIDEVDRLAGLDVWSANEADKLKEKVRRLDEANAESYLEKVRHEVQTRQQMQAANEMGVDQPPHEDSPYGEGEEPDEELDAPEWMQEDA